MNIMNKELPTMNKSILNRGYTIDQTILIVAIIAILITIIIATVGWDLISRTSGAKLAAQMRQIEDATGQFYAQHRQWPHQAINAAAPANATWAQQQMYALTGDHPTYNNSIEVAELRNYVTGFRVVGTAGTNTAVLVHDFSGGDAADIIRLYASAPPASSGLNTASTYMILEMVGVPSSEALEADEAIDGDGSQTATRAEIGRVFFTESTASCLGGGATAAFATNTQKTVCYVANLVQ